MGQVFLAAMLVTLGQMTMVAVITPRLPSDPEEPATGTARAGLAHGIGPAAPPLQKSEVYENRGVGLAFVDTPPMEGPWLDARPLQLGFGCGVQNPGTFGRSRIGGVSMESAGQTRPGQGSTALGTGIACPRTPQSMFLPNPDGSVVLAHGLSFETRVK